MAKMANKAWSLSYFTQRLRIGWEETLAELSSTSTSIPEAVNKGVAAFRGNLTSYMTLTGAAMAPTLNAQAVARAASSSNASTSGDSRSPVEKLLLRLIPRPNARSVFVGDVVAFSSPLSSAGAEAQSVLVRRVAALEGEEMVSDDPEDTSFTLAEGHCWVLADNEELKPPAVIDSRTFGPLPLQNIIGRILYSCRSKADHGLVENSKEAKRMDEAILQAELDIDKLCSQ